MKTLDEAIDELGFCLEVCRSGSEAHRMVGGDEGALSYFHAQSITFGRSTPEVRALSPMLYDASNCETLSQARKHIMFAISSYVRHRN